MAILGQSPVNGARDVTRPLLRFPSPRARARAPGCVRTASPAASAAAGTAEAAVASLREEGGGREGVRGVRPRQRKEAEYRNRRGRNEPRLSKQEIKSAERRFWKGDQLSC